MLRMLLVLIVLISSTCVDAWIHTNALSQKLAYSRLICHNRKSSLHRVLASTGDEVSESIRIMSRDQIENELERLNVPYGDCITFSSLAMRLEMARANRAMRLKKKSMPTTYLEEENDPEDEVVEVEETMEKITETLQAPSSIQDLTLEDMERYQEMYGTLQGGLSFEMARELATDPKVARLLQDPKMQAVLQAIMKDGSSALKKYLADPDTMMLLESFNRALAEKLSS